MLIIGLDLSKVKAVMRSAFAGGVLAYCLAVAKKLASASYDVLAVAALSTAPILFGRLSLAISPELETHSYWDFIYNGQLAFFTMGPLASLTIMSFKDNLPLTARQFFGFISVVGLIFLAVLVAKDPTLQSGMAFVGTAAWVLYLGVLVLRILAEAMKSVGTGEALTAGTNATKATQAALEDRMGVQG